MQIQNERFFIIAILLRGEAIEIFGKERNQINVSSSCVQKSPSEKQCHQVRADFEGNQDNNSSWRKEDLRREITRYLREKKPEEIKKSHRSYWEVFRRSTFIIFAVNPNIDLVLFKKVD